MGKITDAEKKREYADYDGFSSQPLYESFSVIFAEATRLEKPTVGCSIEAACEASLIQ